jgi:hypothetical protein
VRHPAIVSPRDSGGATVVYDDLKGRKRSAGSPGVSLRNGLCDGLSGTPKLLLLSSGHSDGGESRH